ncbi:MAG: 3-methyl-2-oxobutanoate hydroxymethyltransferase [Dehalococcoidia bacterium]|nr:3-methyl-2-oxobutanoate hydroxymethyltransferase [Dehalococcoidia bacterium]
MRITINQVAELKRKHEKFPMLTVYDYSTARLVDEAGIPLILVGDSLGMVLLGYETTLSVTMEDMLHHVKAVARGSKHAMVIADMPFMSYQTGISDAMKNAGRFLQEAGAQAVKVEGGERTAETVKKLVDDGIPVMGHIGLTPQSINQLSGYKVQGKTSAAAAQLINDAKCLEDAGAFSIVLESIPLQLAKRITENAGVPTIGIGAGIHCDGQVLVINDMLGMFSDIHPKFVKQYAHLSENISEALNRFSNEVKNGIFPEEKHSTSVDLES